MEEVSEEEQAEMGHQVGNVTEAFLGRDAVLKDRDFLVRRLGRYW